MIQETPDRVLSIAEVENFTRLSRSTIKRARMRHELKVLQLSPRRIGVRLSDLYKWMESRPEAVKTAEAA